MRLQYVFASLLFIASGCDTMTTLQSVEYTCASATALLKSVTALNLSANDAGKVRHAVTVLNPVCSQQAPPTLDTTARAALDGALAELASVGK